METIALIFALFAFLFAVLAIAGAAALFWLGQKEKERVEEEYLEAFSYLNSAIQDIGRHESLIAQILHADEATDGEPDVPHEPVLSKEDAELLRRELEMQQLYDAGVKNIMNYKNPMAKSKGAGE